MYIEDSPLHKGIKKDGAVLVHRISCALEQEQMSLLGRPVNLPHKLEDFAKEEGHEPV